PICRRRCGQDERAGRLPRCCPKRREVARCCRWRRRGLVALPASPDRCCLILPRLSRMNLYGVGVGVGVGVEQHRYCRSVGRAAMIDASAGVRAARLRRIAAVEIARHREAQGFLGAALEGSLATGAVWPTSDVDFTVVPRPGYSKEHLIEWEQREGLPFLKEHADERIHIDVCGQREGIPWHKHITDHRALLDLVEGYPTSFIPPA